MRPPGPPRDSSNSRWRCCRYRKGNSSIRFRNQSRGCPIDRGPGRTEWIGSSPSFLRLQRSICWSHRDLRHERYRFHLRNRWSHPAQGRRRMKWVARQNIPKPRNHCSPMRKRSNPWNRYISFHPRRSPGLP